MKRFLMLCLAAMVCLSLYAGQKGEASGNWIDRIIMMKNDYWTEVNDKGVYVCPTLMCKTMDAVQISVDVTGYEKLVLLTEGGSDGSDCDHSVWAFARLVRKDGSVLWLDELEINGFAGWLEPRYNRNLDGNPIYIADERCEHSVICHADGVLEYDLSSGEFVRFEAKVGIDDESCGGTAYFKVFPLHPQSYISPFKKEYPQDFYKIQSLLGNIDLWMLIDNTSIEEGIIRDKIGKLKDPSYYQSKFETIAGKADTQAKAREYICMIETLNGLLALQESLKWLDLKAINLAYEDMCSSKDFDAEKYGRLLDELTDLVNEGFDSVYSGDSKSLDNAYRALELKRSILLANPLLDSDRIVVSHYRLGAGAREAMAPQLGTQANNWSNQESASRGGFDAEILELSNLRGEIRSRQVYKPDNGSSIADLRLHWDGERVTFTQTQDDSRWNVFEVRLDGSGFRPLIVNEEPDLEFYDGTYLPDGRVIAVSNIGYQGVPCVNGDDAVGNMVLYNPEDRNLRRLTFDQDANWNPVIMNNGKVMYTRWEYTDLTHYYSRIVMHMNPDGTENKALYGSGAMFPNSTFDVQPLPGDGSAFVGIISGHHGVARSGRMMIFDPSKGRNSIHGIVQEIPYRNRPVVELIKDELVNDVWPQFIKPEVLDEKYFLVSAKLSPESLWGIYLVDVYDNITCIVETEGEGYISPHLVRKSKTPPIIPDRVKLDQKEATFFIQDIYEGEGLRGIPRGTVKELRLHAYEYAYVKTESDHNWHGIQSGWDIKRNLGTVPVEEDGSAMFTVPANTPISIQPLDENGIAVQWMRSWVTGQPGEIVSCVGCHENQNSIVVPKRVMASEKKPRKLTPPEGGVRSFTFDLEIQPILDRSCIACHNGERTFDLRGGKKDEKGYGTSYLNLHPYVHRQGGEGDMVVLQPYEYHPNTSELVRMLKRGHYNVELTDKEWRTIYNWIDYNAPDKGYFNANVLDQMPYKGFDQIQRRIELTNRYGNGAGVDWKQELEDYAEYLKSQGEVVPVVPKPVKEKKQKDLNVKGWPFDTAAAQALQREAGEVRKRIGLAPGIYMSFVRIPAGEFVMGSYNGPSDTSPASKVRIEKPFWMGELEVTNEQFNVFFPEHDSRYVDQQWKDHVIQGYPANEPQQPVIRVSYNDAMEFCRLLSESTGYNVTLPTEAQWEWACRAGSDSEFWYGDLHSDFGDKDNLADRTTLQFAVIGIDPQPMLPTDSWYEYYTFLPKEESVDDACLIQVGGMHHQANPFGLYYMHGNVCEWTRSDYVPYPYKERSSEEAEYKVVRGGSFIERPKFSTSYSRKGFYPYQKVFNVGFRVIIED